MHRQNLISPINREHYAMSVEEEVPEHTVGDENERVYTRFKRAAPSFEQTEITVSIQTMHEACEIRTSNLLVFIRAMAQEPLYPM